MVHWKAFALGLLSVTASTLKAAPIGDVSERSGVVCFRIVVHGPPTTVRAYRHVGYPLVLTMALWWTLGDHAWNSGHRSCARTQQQYAETCPILVESVLNLLLILAGAVTLATEGFETLISYSNGGFGEFALCNYYWLNIGTSAHSYKPL